MNSLGLPRIAVRKIQWKLADEEFLACTGVMDLFMLILLLPSVHLLFFLHLSRVRTWGCAKGAEKASCGETVAQTCVFGESVSSLLPYEVFKCFKSKP